MARLSGPLLVLSGQAAALNKAGLEVTEIIKVTDPAQGGFRPFVEFAIAGQTMRGLLDTGSSDWNIPVTGSAFCKGAGEQCDGLKTGFKAGSLDLAKAGKQVQDLKVPLNASYTGGAGFFGSFVEAPLQVSKGGKAVPVQIGLIESGSVPAGEVSFPVLGVGPVAGESAHNIYANVPARFKEEGKIKVNAFGLFLGSFRSPNSGSLVWGGYDAAKFDGELKTAPLIKDNNGSISRFVVGLSSIRLSPSTVKNAPSLKREQSGISSSLDDAKASAAQVKSSIRTRLGIKMDASSYEHTRNDMSARAIFRRKQAGNILSNDVPPVVWLDTGVPQIIVPEGTLKTLMQLLGARLGDDGEFLVDCKRIAGMDLVFGMNKEAVQIRVPLESITPIESSKKARATGGGGGGTCTLLLSATTSQGGGIPVLGAPALQHMYVVFDMDSKALLMAQAREMETQADIREYVPAALEN
ncbi:hypothetical protein E4U21_006962 [Claviceps maximensis]|nr:hypothetical protein E4U21_006962 [Claviceps maximensis]